MIGSMSKRHTMSILYKFYYGQGLRTYSNDPAMVAAMKRSWYLTGPFPAIACPFDSSTNVIECVLDAVFFSNYNQQLFFFLLSFASRYVSRVLWHACAL